MGEAEGGREVSARENILGRVRTSLRRPQGTPVPPPPPVRIRIPEVPLERRIETFCTALEVLAAKTLVAASPAEAAEYVERVVAGRNAWSTQSPLLAECGISYPAVEKDKAEVGITGADYGLADTGTLVVLGSSDPRLASLLPPVHIALLKLDTLLTGLDELLTRLPKPAEQTASMVLITGPSRTADIEQILVRGVHGPGELHVILLP